MLDAGNKNWDPALVKLIGNDNVEEGNKIEGRLVNFFAQILDFVKETIEFVILADDSDTTSADPLGCP